MHFSSLQGRLVAHIRSRVRSGELTERSAARLTGVSQPHLHNVLKGARLLSTDMADQVLRSLNLCVFDLLKPDEFREYEQRSGANRGVVPMLRGRLGPGLPFPKAEGSRERFPFRLPGIQLLGDPALVELAEDPHMSPLFRGGDLALLDRAAARCREPHVECCYAVETAGQGLVRRLARREGGLALFGMRGGQARSGDFVSVADRNILEIVKAKVVWIGRNLEPFLSCTEID